MDYCEHDPPIGELTRRPRIVTHVACGLPVRCQLCALDGVDWPATDIHIDYIVCPKHMRVAIDNVASRET